MYGDNKGCDPRAANNFLFCCRQASEQNWKERTKIAEEELRGERARREVMQAQVNFTVVQAAYQGRAYIPPS